MKAGIDGQAPFLAFHSTVRGASHIRRGVVCQDCSDSAASGNAAFVSVADGHGDVRHFRSELGARFAAETAMGAMQEFASRFSAEEAKRNADEKLKQLEKNIILSWNKKVALHFADNPFREEELAPLSAKRVNLLRNGEIIESAYGTTLIASAVTPEYWFAMQIGDGDCFAVSAGGETVFVPKEDGLAGNLTTSLCEPDAFSRFHHVFRTEAVPEAVLMSTDGVKNSFTSFDHYDTFMRKVAAEFSGGDYAETEQNLSEFLAEMTEKGSGDDLSVAGVLARTGILQR